MLFVAAVVATIAFCYMHSPFPQEVRSLSWYSQSRARFAPHLVEHFPEKRPADSTNPIFSFYPGMMQGGAWIQLRLRTNQTQVQEIVSRLDAETTHIYQGGSFFTHHNLDQVNNLPTASFHTSRENESSLEFPNHFTLYVLHAKDGGGGWNHGETAGIAVSLKTNEVIYWAEDW